MSTEGISHEAVQERTKRIPLFTIVAIGLGLVGGFVALVTTMNLWLVGGIVGVSVLIAIPITDVGPPHRWVVREWGRRAQWRTDKGHRLAPALTADDVKTSPGKVERIEAVNARVVESVGRKKVSNFMPVLTTKERHHATACLQLSGASEQWLKGDGADKLAWDDSWMRAMRSALGTTNEPDLQLVMTRVHRPSNKEKLLKYGRQRLDQEVIQAAGDASGSAKQRLGDNIIERIDKMSKMTGEPRNYAFIRTRWPRRGFKKIGLNDAGAFKRSALFRTISKVLQAYDQNDVKAEFLTPSSTVNMWQYFMDLKHADTVNLYRARDEEAAKLRAGSEEVSEEIDLPLPPDINYSKPGEPAWWSYNGTIFIAGYYKEVNQPYLRPGFLRAAFALDDGTYYAFSTIIETVLKSKTKRRTREKERLATMTEDANPLNKGVSNDDSGARISAIREWRQRIREGGNRTAQWFKVASLVSTSLEDAEDRWNDLVTETATYYELQRVETPEAIEDIICAQLGVRMKR